MLKHTLLPCQSQNKSTEPPRLETPTTQNLQSKGNERHPQCLQSAQAMPRDTSVEVVECCSQQASRNAHKSKDEHFHKMVPDRS